MKLFLSLFLSLPLLVALTIAQVETDAPRPAIEHYNVEQGLALDGYDPTSYFPEGGGAPLEGRRELETAHAGVTYRFASEENRRRFLADPSRYEPAYGGWCAWAMAQGKQAPADPTSFRIEDDRLLVFYKSLLNDTRKKWEKEDTGALRSKADASWARISGEGTRRDVSHYNLEKGLALGGFDPVGYREGAARAGKQTLNASFQGVEYRFASEAAHRTFLANPASFEPHFGGWCAWAMAQGKKVPVDPEAFVRDGDGLFLFYNKDKRDEWIADRERMLRSGNEHWARITASE